MFWSSMHRSSPLPSLRDHPPPTQGGTYSSACFYDLPEAPIHPLFGFPAPRGTLHEAPDTGGLGA